MHQRSSLKLVRPSDLRESTNLRVKPEEPAPYANIFENMFFHDSSADLIVEQFAQLGSITYQFHFPVQTIYAYQFHLKKYQFL